MKVIKNRPKSLLTLLVIIVFVTCYSFINIGHNKDNKQTDSIKILVTSSNSGNVVFDAVINGERLIQQNTPFFEYEIETKNLESVFHQVGGNGKIEIKVKHESGELMADWPITVVTIYRERACTFGLDKK